MRPFAIPVACSAAMLLLAAPGPRPARAASDPSAAEAREAQAVEQLARIEQAMWSRDAKEIPHLRRWAASDENEQVRERSVGALVLLGDKSEGYVYVDRLSRDKSARVRRAAAEGIGVLKIRLSGPLLVSTLQKDPDPMVRAEVARTIGLTQQTLAGPALLGAIAQDLSPEVRALSAEAYARLKLNQGTELLSSAALRDPSLLVRLNAVKALVATAPLDGQPAFKAVWETARESEVRVEALRGLLLARPAEWEAQGMASSDDQVRFLALKEWVERQFPRRKELHPARTAPEVARLEPFLQDTVRGIRDIARETAERLGFRIKTSGFGYQIAD